MKIKKGFTLVELMVTIAIIVIIALLAVPSFIDQVNKRQLERSYGELALTFSNARSQAVTIRQNVEVKLNSTDLITPTLFTWEPSNSKMSLQSGSASSVVFEPSGGVQNFDNNTMTFSVCHMNSKKTKRLQLTRMGSITMLADGTC